jgi:hypothetical protein
VRSFAAWLMLALVSGTARAAEPRRTVVRFDGDEIDGRVQHPEGELVAGRRAADGGRLSRPPPHFDAAARRALEEAADALAPGRRRR